jgi:YgiT-type zinc finger domain-containing protein
MQQNANRIPSRLVLGWWASRPIHVVVADNAEEGIKDCHHGLSARFGGVGTRLQEEKETMKCVICKVSETRPGRATVTLERDATTLVIKNVPADICANCGEEYVSAETTELLLRTAEEAVRSGVQVSVRDYVAA